MSVSCNRIEGHQLAAEGPSFAPIASCLRQKYAMVGATVLLTEVRPARP